MNRLKSEIELTATGITLTRFVVGTHTCGHPAYSYRSRRWVFRRLAELEAYASRTRCGSCDLAAMGYTITLH